MITLWFYIKFTVMAWIIRIPLVGVGDKTNAIYDRVFKINLWHIKNGDKFEVEFDYVTGILELEDEVYKYRQGRRDTTMLAIPEKEHGRRKP